MIIAARNSFMTGSGRPTAKSYVQDGLVAMWDGIENAGWGTHVAAATTWKDLSGNGWGFPASNLRFHADHVEALAKVSSAKSSTDFWDWSAATFESVCERPYTTDWNNGFFQLGRIGIFNINNPAINAYSWYTNQSTSNWRALYLFSREADARNFDLAHRGFVTDFTSPKNNQQVFRNGIYLPNLVYVDEMWTQTIAHNALRATLNKGTVGTPKYWCIRLYNRALTAEEIQHNFKIDKKRFGLP